MTDAPGLDATTEELLDYMGADGQRWAEEFVKRFPHTETASGTLIGWFANAVEAGRQEQARRSIPQLAFEANTNAHNKGWWKDGRLFDGVLMLIVSETAEALEAWRDNHPVDESWFSIPVERPDLIDYEDEDLRMRIFLLEGHSNRKHITRERLAENFTDDEVDLMINKGHLKPEGCPSELADIIIRVFDCAVEYGIDIEEEVINKMAYNATRSHRHGGKRS